MIRNKNFSYFKNMCWFEPQKIWQEYLKGLLKRETNQPLILTRATHQSGSPRTRHKVQTTVFGMFHTPFRRSLVCTFFGISSAVGGRGDIFRSSATMQLPPFQDGFSRGWPTKCRFRVSLSVRWIAESSALPGWSKTNFLLLGHCWMEHGSRMGWMQIRTLSEIDGC